MLHKIQTVNTAVHCLVYTVVIVVGPIFQGDIDEQCSLNIHQDLFVLLFRKFIGVACISLFFDTQSF